MRPQTVNTAQLTTLFRKELELCQVGRGETVILLSNLNTRREYVMAGFAAADELGADIYELGVSQVPDWARARKELGKGKGMLEALKSADLVITFQPPNFSSWQKEVRAGGTRVLSCIVAPDELAKLMSPPGLKEAVLHAAARWGAAREIRLLSDAGTDLTWTRGEFAVKSQYGFAESAGRVDQWGAGHITNYPDEGSANGTVVLQPGDFWILPYIRMIESEIRLEVRDGFIRKVTGGADARAFTTWLDRNKLSPDDLDPYAVSHLGFGLHPGAHWDQILLYGNDLEHIASSGRVFSGNFLFSTGPNNDMGGKRTTKGHIDTPMVDCTVLLDDEVIMERGKFRDERLIVAPGWR
jgi:2,5-dihydroxypyridine 5,6-dioxygenase